MKQTSITVLVVLIALIIFAGVSIAGKKLNIPVLKHL